MAQTVRITLTRADEGTGPFNLFSDVDGFYNPFEANISLETLKAGYISYVVPDLATTIQVKSYNSICQTYIDLYITPPPHPITAGLVLNFDIDNKLSYPGSGNIVTNLYNNNQISLVNGPTYDSNSPASILLDGTNDYMITSNYTDIQLGENMSYETIIKVGTSGFNNGNFYAKNFNNGLRIRVKSSGNIEVINTTDNQFTTSGAGLVENTKYHIVFTGGIGGTGCKVYVNGVQRGTVDTAFIPYAGSAGIYFGSGNGSDEPFKGNIYLGRQYNRALSQAEVTAAYNYYQPRYNL